MAIRILLVEDTESDYLLMRQMLSSVEGESFDLIWASSWQEGIEAIRRETYDVCLLDYRIEGADGLELLKESRKIGRKAPVILLTGVSDYRLDVEAMRLGAADFLVKDQLTAALLERSIRYAIAEARREEELYRQQEELRASELRFRSVVQSAGDAIILAGKDGKIIFWNKGAETMFGYTEQEVTGSQLEILMPEQYRERHRAGLERIRMGGSSRLIGKTAQFEGLRKDGEVFPLELSLASWSTSEGMFFTGIVREISDRRRAEEMQVAKEAAEQANRAKSSFLARMSHDLRTPLHAIIGFTQILLQNKSGNLYTQDVDLLQRILLNASDQLRLINSILDLSKIEAGRMELELAPAALDGIVREVVMQLEAERQSASVQIVICVPQELEPLETDGYKLKQVLMNLVHNALKFTERGTVTIQILTGGADRRPIRIDVADTGPGIEPGRLNEIFQPFQQAAPVMGGKHRGTGLGLAISRSLCDLMGYALQVESHPGRGSTFSVILTSGGQLPLSA